MADLGSSGHDALAVDVRDENGTVVIGPAAGPMPPPRSSRGPGLPIVDSLADEWGITPARHGPGKSIWFKITVPALARHSPA